MDVYKWHNRAICPQCGWHTWCPFGMLFHLHVEVCPECGTKKSNLWTVETMRYRTVWSPVVWWKPWTWISASGHWQCRH